MNNPPAQTKAATLTGVSAAETSKAGSEAPVPTGAGTVGIESSLPRRSA